YSRSVQMYARQPGACSTTRRRLVAERIVISSEQGRLEIEDPDKSEQLSQVLREPAAFGEFVQNPREFVRGYGITIDQKVSDQLHQALQGVKSAEELETSGYVLSTTQ